MINGKRIAVVMPAYNAEKTLQVTVERGEGRRPLVTRWGGIPLTWQMAAILDDQPPARLEYTE